MRIVKLSILASAVLAMGAATAHGPCQEKESARAIEASLTPAAPVEKKTVAKSSVENRVVSTASKHQGMVTVLSPKRYSVANGGVVTVVLQMRANQPLRNFDAVLRTPDGLNLSSGNEQLTRNNVAAGETLQWQFDVLALEEGRWYVDIVFSGDTEAGVRMKAWSVPVEVGDVERAAAAKPGPVIVTDQRSGRAIRVMRSVELIEKRLP